jgi:hypothetical protein
VIVLFVRCRSGRLGKAEQGSGHQRSGRSGDENRKWQLQSADLLRRTE